MDFCPFRGKKTEGERTRGCCLHPGVGVHKMIQVSLLLGVRLYILLLHALGVSLLPSRRFYPLYAVPPLPPRRSPLVLRLFALALADGSGLPFSLYPPQEALESQTPQREARALPRRALKSTASERKIVTKETHQGCVFVQVAFALQRRGECAPAPTHRFNAVRSSALHTIPHSDFRIPHS